MTIAPQSSPPHGRLPAAAGLVLATLTAVAIAAPSGPVGALLAQQAVRLQADTPFHSDPDGTRLGALLSGLRVVPGRTQRGWRQVTFDGWIFTASTGPSTRREFSLMVSAPNGENIRSAPDGELVARAVRGTGFREVARRGGWTQVRRTAWVPAEALSRPAVRTARSQPPPPPRPAAAPPADSAAPPPPAIPERVLVRPGARLSLSPGGTEVGPAPEELAAEVVGRSGNWVRLRTEAWVRAEDIRPAPGDSTRVTLEMLRADPQAYVGRRVAWRLQFLSVQTADELRPELPPGQPYLLTRGPLPEVGFVYVMVNPEQAARFRAMNPLDEFVARGAIRASRTRYLPTPVLELER